MFEVAVDLGAQLFGRPSRGPATFGIPLRPDLGYDVQLVRVRGECLADDLVGDAWAVVVGGVYVGDAEVYRFAQHRDRGVAVFRRPEDAGTRELHRAIAHVGDAQIVGHRERPAGEVIL